jgi:predicted deacylase
MKLTKSRLKKRIKKLKKKRKKITKKKCSLLEMYKKSCFPIINEFNYNQNFKRVLFVCGTHGDEPSGVWALQDFPFSKYEDVNIVVCQMNPCGVIKNTRTHPTLDLDLNRTYDKDILQNKIVKKLVTESDVIVDFHEGWDYHIINKDSIGSSLQTNSLGEICEFIIKKLNKTIQPKNKHFILSDTPVIKGSLREYCDNKQKPYILVETTRIESEKERIRKCKIVINYILKIARNSLQKRQR